MLADLMRDSFLQYFCQSCKTPRSTVGKKNSPYSFLSYLRVLYLSFSLLGYIVFSGGYNLSRSVWKMLGKNKEKIIFIQDIRLAKNNTLLG